MSGAAITICPQQLKGLFGLAYFTTVTDVISVLHAVLKNPDEILSFVPPIMYVIFVPLGTVAAASLFPAATIQENMSPDTDPHLYPNSIFIGIFQSVLGFLRLGIVVDILLHSMIVGFISGTASVLSQQQLKGMFGLTHLATKADVISLSHAVLKNRDENLLGEGGFGRVYHGVLSTGEEVAVKRLMGASSCKEASFQAEVQTLDRTQHRNIVSLFGYCIDRSERMLVYEYVPNRSLEFHLHGAGCLPWEARMKVAVGCANGLTFLHEDCRPAILHGDIKPDNILLSSDFEPKIADFGLAEFVSESSHRVSNPGGTFGSDTLSFGVLLLELITGCRPELPLMRPRLAQALRVGYFASLVDSRLQNDYNHSEMARMVACAAACVSELAQHRPTMSLIARVLEGDRSAADLDDGTGAGPSNLDLEDGSGRILEEPGPLDKLRRFFISFMGQLRRFFLSFMGQR